MLRNLIRQKNSVLVQTRSFAALNASTVKLDSLNPADILDSDSKAVGVVMQ